MSTCVEGSYLMLKDRSNSIAGSMIAKEAKAKWRPMIHARNADGKSITDI